MSSGPALPGDASERYLILIDLPGYTGFLAGVERTHGKDFSAGLPAGFGSEGWPMVSPFPPDVSVRTD